MMGAAGAVIGLGGIFFRPALLASSLPTAPLATSFNVGSAFLLLRRKPLLAHWAEADCATLHALQVDKRVQGQGLGKACLRQLPLAVSLLWPEIRQLMLSVSPFNTSALAFYLSQGWVECGEAYLGERRLVLDLAEAHGTHAQAS